MSKDMQISDFYTSIMDEVDMAKDALDYGWEMQDAFTSVMLSYLEDVGEATDPILCPFRGYGLQLNAYSISEDFEDVEIFVTVFQENLSMHSTPTDDISSALNRGLALYRKSMIDLYESFKKDSATYEFAITLKQHKDDIKKVKLVALTNGTVKAIPFQPIHLYGAEVSFSIWDIDRLYRCVISGKMRETIEIDFQNDYGETIPCLENTTSDKYKVYLAILSGKLLAEIYDAYGPRLLEKNVRSFLQVKGEVNKGIRDTLREEPDMFLAYNNGISVTAESVEVIRDQNGKPSITKIRDMQIVNGGQTTASIHNAMKDKKINSDLSKVYVQMKLSVIERSEDVDVILPRISAYANTQNKIQTADFSANDPYHRRIEELSRTIWTPSVNGSIPINWFYERARGQYANMLSKESTTKRRKDFKALHPLFTKTDLAKYLNTWNQLPYQVCEGAQKNFKRFTLAQSEIKKVVPDEDYYKLLIAKAVLFKKTEKIVQDQKYGGYRAQIVTYTIAYLSYVSSKRIDLQEIWKTQDLSPALVQAITDISKLVRDVIVNPPNGANIGEWSKKDKCWEEVKTIEYTIPSSLIVVHKDESSQKEKGINVQTGFTGQGDEEIFKKASSIPANTWFALSKWGKETEKLNTWQRSFAFSMGRLASSGKEMTYKQAEKAVDTYDEAISKGFE